MAAKTPFSWTRAREYRIPTRSRLRLRLRRARRPERSDTEGSTSTPAADELRLSLTPILLLHGSQGDGGWIEAGELQVDTALGADEDLTRPGARLPVGRGGAADGREAGACTSQACSADIVVIWGRLSRGRGLYMPRMSPPGWPVGAEVGIRWRA